MLPARTNHPDPVLSDSTSSSEGEVDLDDGTANNNVRHPNNNRRARGKKKKNREEIKLLKAEARHRRQVEKQVLLKEQRERHRIYDKNDVTKQLPQFATKPFDHLSGSELTGGMSSGKFGGSVLTRATVLNGAAGGGLVSGVGPGPGLTVTATENSSVNIDANVTPRGPQGEGSGLMLPIPPAQGLGSGQEKERGGFHFKGRASPARLYTPIRREVVMDVRSHHNLIPRAPNLYPGKTNL